MGKRITLTGHFNPGKPHPAGTELSLIRLDENETYIMPFTKEIESVQTHFLEDEHHRGVVQCNGSDCVLCIVGRKRDEKVLVPVYLPVAKKVGILAMSPSTRPGALWPQICPRLLDRKRQVLFVSRPDRVKYVVGVGDLAQGVDDGAEVISTFLNQLKEERLELSSVYRKLTNRELADIPSISAMLALKGIRPNEIH